MYLEARLESLQTAQPISFFPEILHSEFSFLRGKFSFLRSGVIFCAFNFYLFHCFLLLAFLSHFSVRFIVQYYFVRCENVHLRSG